ncbi:MAG: DUF3108 domain-containing protein [Gammaproteobacteria bacterium]
MRDPVWPCALVALLGMLITPCGSAASAPPSGLVAYRAVYSVHLDGIGIGISHLTLKPGPKGLWICHSEAKPNAFFGLFDSAQLNEQSRFRIRHGRMEALFYSLTEPGRSPQHDQGVRFDWRKHFAYAHVGPHKKVFPLRSGEMDRLSAQIALSRDLVLHGRPPKVFRVINHNHLHRYHFVMGGKRKWRTPIGIFPTVAYVRRSLKGATLTFWCASTLYEIPIVARQTRHGHPTITLHLIGFRRLPTTSTHQVLGKVTPR